MLKKSFLFTASLFCLASVCVCTFATPITNNLKADFTPQPSKDIDLEFNSTNLSSGNGNVVIYGNSFTYENLTISNGSIILNSGSKIYSNSDSGSSIGANGLKGNGYNNISFYADSNSAAESILCEEAYSIVLEGGESINKSFYSTSFNFEVTSGSLSLSKLVLRYTCESNENAPLTNLKLFNRAVSGNTFDLSDTEFKELVNGNVSNYVSYDEVEGLSVESTFNQAKGSILVVASKPGYATVRKNIVLNVISPFKKYGNGEFGNENPFTWDNEKARWLTNSTTESVYTGFKNGNSTVSGIYDYTANFKISSGESNSEFVIEAFVRANKTIRLVLRMSDATSYVIFTDFRDDSNFLDYRVLKTVSDYDGGYINMGITVFNGKVLLIIDGEMQYRRGLDDFTNSELVVSNTANMKAEVDSFEVKTNATEVEEIYNTKAAGYNDHFFGKTIGSTFNLDWTSEDYVNGAYSMWTEQANTSTPGDNSKSSLVSIYKDGNPLYGNSWAVSGTLEVIYYSNNPHVVFYYYQDNNHQCRYLLNLNTNNNNNIIYYYVTNAEKENINLTAIPSTKNAMVNEYGTITKNYDDNGTTRTALYSAPFTYLYDNGHCILYLANVLMYDYDSGFGQVNALLQAKNRCKMTFKDVSITKNPAEVEAIRLAYEGETSPSSQLSNNIFDIEGRAEVKKSYSYSYASYMRNNAVYSSNNFYSTFTTSNINPHSWGQCETKVVNSNGNGYRFVHEYLWNGTYQIFSEKISGGATFSEWKLLAQGVNRDINAGIIVHNGRVKFLILRRGYEYLCDYELDTSQTYQLCFGGKECIFRVKDIVVEDDESNVETFNSNLVEYTYLSPYENKCANYYEQNKTAEKGQTLLIGTSTFDFWRSSHKDSNGKYVNGYLEALNGLPDNNDDGLPDVLNFGIGGAKFKDLISFYDRLVKYFEPSRIIFQCGANDLASGMSVEETYNLFLQYMDVLRNDFPTVEILFIPVGPSPLMYGSTYKTKTMQLNNLFKDYCNSHNYISYVPIENGLTYNDEPIAELWDATNHMSKEGYDVFTTYIREALGLE